MDIGARAEITHGSRRRTAVLAVATAAVVVIGVVAAVAVASRGANETRGGAAPAAPTQLRTSMEWIDGLAAGHILPSDVTSRLSVQDPEVAGVVEAAWSDLRSSGNGARLQRAVGWVDGLAAGLILRSDVTSRLSVQDPEMANVVIATWSDLGPFANRSV
jgi:hypothetical protein